jgi:hypothetical protein
MRGEVEPFERCFPSFVGIARIRGEGESRLHFLGKRGIARIRGEGESRLHLMGKRGIGALLITSPSGAKRG